MQLLDKKVKIYALSNTLNGSVFYIGATVQRLEARASGHSRTIFHRGRGEYMAEATKKGAMIEMIEIDECDLVQAKFWEQFYIDLFRSWGFNLIQKRISTYTYNKAKQ